MSLEVISWPHSPDSTLSIPGRPSLLLSLETELGGLKLDLPRSSPILPRPKPGLRGQGSDLQEPRPSLQEPKPDLDGTNLEGNRLLAHFAKALFDYVSGEQPLCIDCPTVLPFRSHMNFLLGSFRDALKVDPFANEYAVRVLNSSGRCHIAAHFESLCTIPDIAAQAHQSHTNWTQAVLGAHKLYCNDITCAYLVGHEAFKTLVTRVSNVLRRHYTNMMTFIDRTVLLEAGRCELDYIEKEPLRASQGIMKATLTVDLDIASFLAANYDLSNPPDIGSVIAITGQAQKAQLLSVSSYFEQTWPKYPHTFLGAVRRALSSRSENWSTENVVVDFKKRMVYVEGPQDLIVTIAQQLSWLCAALKGPERNLTYAHTNFNAGPFDSNSRSSMNFIIESELLPVPDEVQEDLSCWRNLLPNSVIVTGFPIQTRFHGERGLEVPVDIMAALGGIRTATKFSGGFLLKSHSIAFVPIERWPGSVQWHFIDDCGKDDLLPYADIDQKYPQRLKGIQLSEEDLQSTRAFVDWCGKVVDHTATQGYNYSAVQEASNLKPLPTMMFELTSGSVGISKIVTAQLSWTLSHRKDGRYNAKQPNFYTTTLNRASQRYVILLDTKQGRAHCIDGARYILHTIRHRLRAGHYGSGFSNEFSKPADPTTPVSKWMLAYRNEILESGDGLDRNIESKLFRHEVQEVYEAIELQIAELRRVSDAVKCAKMLFSQYIYGYRWLEAAQDAPEMYVERYKLPNSAGKWIELVQDAGALVLFADNFGELVEPLLDGQFGCQTFPTVPCHQGFLSISPKKLNTLLLKHHGLYWNGTPDVFNSCEYGYSRPPTGKVGVCGCDRITDLADKGTTMAFNDNDFPVDGAIILGRRGVRPLQHSTHLRTMGHLSHKANNSYSPKATLFFDRRNQQTSARSQIKWYETEDGNGAENGLKRENDSTISGAVLEVRSRQAKLNPELPPGLQGGAGKGIRQGGDPRNVYGSGSSNVDVRAEMKRSRRREERSRMEAAEREREVNDGRDSRVEKIEATWEAPSTTEGAQHEYAFDAHFTNLILTPASTTNLIKTDLTETGIATPWTLHDRNNYHRSPRLPTLQSAPKESFIELQLPTMFTPSPVLNLKNQMFATDLQNVAGHEARAEERGHFGTTRPKPPPRRRKAWRKLL